MILKLTVITNTSQGENKPIDQQIQHGSRFKKWQSLQRHISIGKQERSLTLVLRSMICTFELIRKSYTLNQIWERKKKQKNMKYNTNGFTQTTEELRTWHFTGHHDLLTMLQNPLDWILEMKIMYILRTLCYKMLRSFFPCTWDIMCAILMVGNYNYMAITFWGNHV